jgi:hypothetical protein
MGEEEGGKLGRMAAFAGHVAKYAPHIAGALAGVGTAAAIGMTLPGWAVGGVGGMLMYPLYSKLIGKVSDKTTAFFHGGIDELVNGAKEEKNQPKTPTGKALLTAAKLYQGYKNGKLELKDFNTDDLVSMAWNTGKAGVHVAETAFNLGGRMARGAAHAYDWVQSRRGMSIPKNYGAPGGAQGGYFNPTYMRNKIN